MDPLSTKKSPPIPLDYARAERIGALRQEWDATAYGIGGWLQVALAIFLCLLGMFTGLWAADGTFHYLSAWLGLSGFVIGLLLPIPQDRYGWERFVQAILGGMVGALIGWWIFSPGWELTALCGYRIGLALYDEK